MKSGSAAWWAGKIRQARRHLVARVAPTERDELATWLAPAQLALFEAMHPADRRHGLDVAAWLRAHGETDPGLLIAGLLHDAGKGDAGFVARVAYSLSQAYGAWIAGLAMTLPGIGPSVRRLVRHAESSARLADEAGCSPLTVQLIRRQGEPPTDEQARRLHLADEAS